MNEFDENESLSSETRYDGFGKKRAIAADYGDAGGISVTKYNLILGGVLLWGFLANVLICFFTRNVSLIDYAIPILIGYLVFALVGVLLTKSHSAVVSFIGYNFVVIPLGFFISFSDKISGFQTFHINIPHSAAFVKGTPQICEKKDKAGKTSAKREGKRRDLGRDD